MLISISLGVLPIIATSEQIYGFWMTAMSIGTLIGSGVALRLANVHLKRIFVIATLLGGCAWSFSLLWVDTNVIITLFLFSLVWIAIGVMGIQFQTLLQIHIEEAYLGRTLTIIYAVQGFLAPIGYLLGGIFADYVSPSSLYGVGALTLLGASMYFRYDSFLKTTL